MNIVYYICVLKALKVKIYLLKAFVDFFSNIPKVFRRSKTFRVLLLIVLFKFLLFYGFLKAFLYPRYLKPKWESEQHRIDSVTDDLIEKRKTKNHD